jgi:hypothetical protein
MRGRDAYAFSAAGQHMRLKCRLSIINNDRNLYFVEQAFFRCSGGADGLGRNRSLIFVQLRGPLRDIICWGRVQIFMMLDRNPGRRLPVASGDLPAFGSNFADLEHHLSQRRDGSFWMRSLSIKSVGLNLDLGDLNAEFFERRNR